MFNLFVTAMEDKWETSPTTTELSRFPGYTDPDLRERFKDLSDAASEELKSFPALFAYESPINGLAKIGWLKKIVKLHSKVKIDFEFDERFEPIRAEDLERVRHSLEITEKFEMTTTHWAIKDVDLLEALAKSDLLKMAITSSKKQNFSRQTVLYAADLLQLMGHSEFDRLILEIGIDDIGAGRDCGGLKARSVALSAYVVKQMDRLTAEGEPLALTVIRQAARLDPDYPRGELPHINKRSRDGFWQGLKKDGYTFRNGDIIYSPADDTAILDTNEERPTTPQMAFTSSHAIGKTAMSDNKPRVFIVHGRNDAVKNDVARFVERIGLEATILHEQPNGGRTIIQKFREEAAGAVFAVVLMTPDDVGGLDTNSLKPRARQNVIFELGFFIGQLGANRVCALVSGNIEKPSDFEAVVYISYGEDGGWKMGLARELHHAGVTFDQSKLYM